MALQRAQTSQTSADLRSSASPSASTSAPRKRAKNDSDKPKKKPKLATNARIVSDAPQPIDPEDALEAAIDLLKRLATCIRFLPSM